MYAKINNRNCAWEKRYSYPFHLFPYVKEVLDDTQWRDLSRIDFNGELWLVYRQSLS